MKRIALTAALLVALVCPDGAPRDLQAAQATATKLDRTKPPGPGKSPTLRTPTWTKATLSNGAELLVSERHDLPLVSFSISFLGGSSQFEPATRKGVAGITAAMLSEGTKTRDGEALSNALQLLGTSVQVGIGSESGSISFTSTAAKFPATLDIVADMLLNSTFPAESLERLRAQRLVALTQAKDQTGAIAANVFPRTLYGAAHPYGQFTTEQTMKAINRDNIATLYKEYYQPGRAVITVVGDVKADTVRGTIEKAFAGWAKGGSKPAFTYPTLPAPKQTTIYLVDKPGAAQSTVAVGVPGPPRNTPDYSAMQVMNTMLGGMFQSRLNANIREEKGYSYGVFSNFTYGKGPGPFRAGGDIVTDKTDEALVEFMKELRGIRGDRPITDEELKTAKDSLIQRLPGQFASIQMVNSAINSLWLQGLPDDYYQQYSKAIAAVTKEDVLRVAKKYIDIDRLALVIVGDRAQIEAPLKATNIAPIVLLDLEGNPK
jgi:zinc protease